MGKPDYYIDFASKNVVYVRPASGVTTVVPGEVVYVFVESGTWVFDKATAGPGFSFGKSNYFGITYGDPGQPDFLHADTLEAYPIKTEGFCYIPNYQIVDGPVAGGDVLYLRTLGGQEGRLQKTRPSATSQHVVPVCMAMQAASVGLSAYTLVYIFPNDFYRGSCILSKCSGSHTVSTMYAAPGQFIKTDTSSNNVSILLPPSATNPIGSIVGVRVDDASNETRIYPDGTDTIDGVGSGTPVVLTEYGSYREFIWDGTEWKTRIKTELISSTSEDKIIYVGKHGNDSYDGETISRARLTLTSAITLVGTKSPGTADRWTIVVLDAGIYTEALTFANSFVSVFAPNARIVGNVTLLDNTSLVIDTIDGTVIKGSGTGIASIKAREIDGDTGDAVTCDSGTLNLDVHNILVSTGSGLAGDANLRGQINRIYVSGAGNAIDAEANCVYDLFVHEIDASATGGDGILVAAGAEVNITIHHLEADDDAYVVTATGLLNLIVHRIIGDEVGDPGDVNVVRPVAEDNVIYVGKHGNDTYDGSTIENARLSISAALTLASAKSPSTSDRWTIVVLDAGIYTETVTMPTQYVSIYAPKARIVGNVTMTHNTSLEIDSIDGTVIKNAGISFASLRAREIDADTADAITCDLGYLNIDVENIYVSTGSALAGDSYLIGRVGHILVSGSGGNAIDAEASCVYNLTINEIDASATGGDGILVAAGAEVNLNIQKLVADDDAFNVTATGLLNLIVNSISGDEVGSAADVNIVRPRVVTATQTTAYTANPEETVIVDPSTAGFTVTFPAAPVAGTFVRVTNITTSTNVVTVDGGSNNIEDPDDGVGSMGTTATLTGSGFSYGFLFTGTFWKVVEKW